MRCLLRPANACLLGAPRLLPRSYEYKNMMTPYEKFKSLPDAKEYLKADVTFEKLDDLAKSMTDNEAADYLQQQRKLLFKDIHEGCEKRA